MDAGTLNCPQCGAAVAKDATQCQYCHALLETMACPKCMGMMFVGSKFCPHCGAWAEQVAAETSSSAICPNCNLKLENVRVADTEMGECTSCGGLWMKLATFEHLCSSALAQADVSVVKHPVRGVLDGEVKYLKCPECGGLMNRMNYAGRSGIVINVCKPHGVWLRRDEMREVMEFIRSGGLEQGQGPVVEDGPGVKEWFEDDLR